jgi:hypothetical protein
MGAIIGALEQVLRIELIDAFTPADELVVVVTVAEAMKRRRLSARSRASTAERLPAADGALQRRTTFGATLEYVGTPSRCWVDVWNAAAAPNAPDGFLGKIEVPLAGTRIGVPHLVQRNLLHGGPLRVRVRLDEG